LHVHGIANELKETHQEWSESVRQRFETLMNDLYQQSSQYQCHIDHIERVKPYGPHLDHLVIDLHLFPVENKNQ
jgi:tRNA wybutosine-synthesizing protein 3